MFTPTDMGSGGYLSPGGGAIRLRVGGSLTVNGTISSDGAIGAGTGAGGSVWLEVNTLAGVGTISANGGNANQAIAGTGSGGRVASYSNSSSFSGSMQAGGGISADASLATRGSAGTIYVVNNSTTSLIVDNRGFLSQFRTQLWLNNLTSLTLDLLAVEGNSDLDINNVTRSAPLSVIASVVTSRTKTGILHLGGLVGTQSSNVSLTVMENVQSCSIEVNANSLLNFTSGTADVSIFSTTRAGISGLTVYLAI